VIKKLKVNTAAVKEKFILWIAVGVKFLVKNDLFANFK